MLSINQKIQVNKNIVITSLASLSARPTIASIKIIMDSEQTLQQEINDLRTQLQAKESLLAKINSKKQV